MNLIQFLAVELHEGPVFFDGIVNSIQVVNNCKKVLKVPEGRPKSVVVLETIDAVRKLILHDRHVTFCEIETTIGISGTYIQYCLNIWL